MYIDKIAKLSSVLLFILATQKGEINALPFFSSKRSSCHRYNLRVLGDIACHHGEAIGGVIVQVLRRERKARQLRHRLAVILVATLAIPEIKATDSRRVLLNARELCHIRWRLLVAHIDAVAVFLLQNPVHVLGVFLTAVVYCRL